MIRPLYSNVVVDPYLEEDDIIIIPDQHKHRTGEGKVLYVGKESVLNEGDEIIFKLHSGMDVVHEGKDLLIMGEDEVLGLWEE